MTVPISTYVRVRDGARLLDLRIPDWNQRVAAGRIDMTSERDCVLGQLAHSDPRVQEYMESIMHPQLAEASRGSYLGAAMLVFGKWPTQELMYRYGFSGDVWVQTRPAPANLLDGFWYQEVRQRGGRRGGRLRRGKVLPPEGLDVAVVA